MVVAKNDPFSPTASLFGGGGEVPMNGAGYGDYVGGSGDGGPSLQQWQVMNDYIRSDYNFLESMCQSLLDAFNKPSFPNLPTDAKGYFNYAGERLWNVFKDVSPCTEGDRRIVKKAINFLEARRTNTTVGIMDELEHDYERPGGPVGAALQISENAYNDLKSQIRTLYIRKCGTNDTNSFQERDRAEGIARTQYDRWSNAIHNQRQACFNASHSKKNDFRAWGRNTLVDDYKYFHDGAWRMAYYKNLPTGSGPYNTYRRILRKGPNRRKNNIAHTIATKWRNFPQGTSNYNSLVVYILNELVRVRGY